MLTTLAARHFSITPAFVAEFLTATKQQETAEQYALQPFTLNVLDKRRTMLEKLMSLIRFSFAENPTVALAAKIRHFYDLYYLANDVECAAVKKKSKNNCELIETKTLCCQKKKYQR
jgi:hypothetical protein